MHSFALPAVEIFVMSDPTTMVTGVVIPTIFVGCDNVDVKSSTCTSSSNVPSEPGDGVFANCDANPDEVIFSQKPIVGK